jgi:hypothetical protein
MIKKRRRAEEGQFFVASKANSQEMVKADKVVHMGMRDEDVANFQDLPRREGMKIAHIEKEGSFIKHELHIYSRVAEGIVDRLWMK